MPRHTKVPLRVHQRAHVEGQVLGDLVAPHRRLLLLLLLLLMLVLFLLLLFILILSL